MNENDKFVIRIASTCLILLIAILINSGISYLVQATETQIAQQKAYEQQMLTDKKVAENIDFIHMYLDKKGEK